MRALAGRPTPEGARLAAVVLDIRPPGRVYGLHERVRAALGRAPPAEADHQLQAAGREQFDQGEQAGRADGAVELPGSWLRVWAWSPILPAQLLVGFGPLSRARPGRPTHGPPLARGRAITPRSGW
ncbi:hypothetical protein AB0M32_09545 [Streptomyces sp. NPDC051985]|uniref:hypothetical protein n=1 Tax=Streptomyces sp. NPDC051985 TaxID=3155807 RepID=UPI00344834B1